MDNKSITETISTQSLELHDCANGLSDRIVKFESYLGKLVGRVKSTLAFTDPAIGCRRIEFRREGKNWKLFLTSGDGSDAKDVTQCSLVEKVVIAKHLPLLLISMDSAQRAMIERVNEANRGLDKLFDGLNIHE